MGANFITLHLSGKLSNSSLQEKFRQEQEQDRYENGHSYSGGIGMASGLTILDLTCDSVEIAYEFLEDRCKKWEDAIAVKAKKKDRQIWVIGALCAC
jgi:hypothetical protein